MSAILDVSVDSFSHDVRHIWTETFEGWLFETDTNRYGVRLTEEGGQPLGLVVMYDGYAERVEGHQAQHGPVEGVRLDHAADGDA